MWDFLRALHRQIVRDRLGMVAAGVAFYALLAVFPALGALVALYGLAFDPNDVRSQIDALRGLVPGDALEVVTGELATVTQSTRSALGLGVAGGLALAVWSASKGVRTLMQALNVAYGTREQRGFFRRTALSLALTLGAIVMAALTMALLVAVPALLDLIGPLPGMEAVGAYARWPILAALATLGIALLYRYAPCRKRFALSSVAWGASVATALWLAGSAAFSLYVSSFASYGKTYGSIAGMVVLLFWFLLSAYAVLVGAEISAELERRRLEKEVEYADDHQQADEEDDEDDPAENLEHAAGRSNGRAAALSAPRAAAAPRGRRRS